MSKQARKTVKIKNLDTYGHEFVLRRLHSFEKDLTICLTGMKLKNSNHVTHAYFPALATCFGFIEFLTSLYHGAIKSMGWSQVSTWAVNYLPQPDYNQNTMRLFFNAFRHPVAHRGIANGVWLDTNRNLSSGHRYSWIVKADARRPAINILSENGILSKDPPWDCPYDHRFHIHLRSLRVDLRQAAKCYAKELCSCKKLQKKFQNCMNILYPI